MARIEKVWIAMHGKLSRGMSALDRELAMILVGPGDWIDTNSNKKWCVGCVFTFEEFLLFQRCYVDMNSNIEWFHISALDRELAMTLVGPGDWIDINSNKEWRMRCVFTLEEFLIYQ